METQNNILKTASMPKLFAKYCIPAVIAMIIAGVQGMIDGIFVGNFIGSNALASVNIAMPFMQVIIGISMIVSAGTQSYVAINLGRGNVEKAQNCFHTFKVLLLIIALLITITGLTMNQPIAGGLGANDLLLQDTATYIQTLALFALPMCLMFYLGFLNRVIGKPELYFYGSLLSIVLNVTLDYLFIAQLQWGIRGAALATGIAYTSALCIVILPMLQKKHTINLFVGKFRTESIGIVLYNGASEGINSASGAITTFLFNTSLMAIAGAGGVAGFTAISYIGNLGTMLLFGIADGIGPVVSYNYGMGEYKRVKQAMRLSYVGNFISGTVIFSLLFFAGEALVALFISNDPTVVKLATAGGRLYAFSFLLAGFNILNSGYFTFLGEGFSSMLVAASRGLVFVTIGIFVLPLFLGVDGIWLSVPFAEVCGALIGVLLLLRVNRKMKES